MPPELSEQDKIYKAQAVQQRMELEAELSAFGDLLDQIFKIAPPMTLTPAEEGELRELGATIRTAATSNENRARIMELLGKALRA